MWEGSPCSQVRAFSGLQSGAKVETWAGGQSYHGGGQHWGVGVQPSPCPLQLEGDDSMTHCRSAHVLVSVLYQRGMSIRVGNSKC